MSSSRKFVWSVSTMVSKELQKIIDDMNKQGKMVYLDAATNEQIIEFEVKNKIKFPEKYRQWLNYSDGGEFFLPAGVQFYGVSHKPIINVNEKDRPNENYIVIGALANGDPVVFEKGKENIAIYNHADDRIEEDEIYPDFNEFLKDMHNMFGGIGG